MVLMVVVTTTSVFKNNLFPEVSYDSIVQIHGMNITVVTTADSDKASFALLEKMGMPFSKGSN
jgi:large subunit ribosomal protein L5